MISVFSENRSPRLNYVLDFFFKEKNIDFQVITRLEDWKNIDKCRINYSEQNISAEIQIMPCGLLSETDLRDSIDISPDFKIDGIYDEFAISFFFLSRYEELLPSDRDAHDRILSKDLFAVKNNLHKIPIVDVIVKEVWKDLKLDYQDVLNKFQCVPSFDIDIAWAYKNRPFVRQLGALLKGGKLLRRSKVLMGKERDPYDTFSYINQVSTKVERIISFVLLGDWSKYDKNIDWKNEAYRSLIRGLNTSGGMGIHPSYNSYLDSNRVGGEKKRLNEIVGHDIIKSRQHFLRLNLPKSYEVLEEAGIEKDYSMGFADNIGFRAGTSFPFKYFNLNQNKVSKLQVFPFMYMDSALKDYLNFSVDEASVEVKRLIEEVKNVGGNLMFIWHNSSINDEGEWKGWRSILDMTIEESQNK